MCPSPKDWALIDRLRRGERRAFEEVFELHADAVFALLRRLGGSSALADDLLQDTFLKLAGCAGELRPDTRLGPLLHTIARNTWLSARRAARLDLGAALDEIAGCGASPDSSAGWTELSSRTEEALLHLPPELREVVAMSLSDLDAADAARALGLSDEAYRKRLSRARAALRGSLGRAYAEVFS